MDIYVFLLDGVENVLDVRDTVKNASCTAYEYRGKYYVALDYPFDERPPDLPYWHKCRFRLINEALLEEYGTVLCRFEPKTQNPLS